MKIAALVVPYFWGCLFAGFALRYLWDDEPNAAAGAAAGITAGLSFIAAALAARSKPEDR